MGDVHADGKVGDANLVFRTLVAAEILVHVIEVSMFINMKGHRLRDGMFGSNPDKIRMPDKSRQTKSRRTMQIIKIGAFYPGSCQAVPFPFDRFFYVLIVDEV
ncbi:hypothetical protein D3C85_1466800 [compost metagenome]